MKFPKRVCVFVEYQRMDKFENPGNPECYTLSSEPLRIHQRLIENEHLDKTYVRKRTGSIGISCSCKGAVRRSTDHLRPSVLWTDSS
jgi:hypothetical protein